MVPISITAEASLEVFSRIQSGELEIDGIVVREAVGKKFAHILRGFETLSQEAPQLDLTPLEPLRAAVGLTQILQTVAVAQNAALAMSLRRIEQRLDRIEGRLEGIEARLVALGVTASLNLAALRAQPVSRLKAAKSAAIVALRDGDRTALIAAGKDAQQAYHDLLGLARDLVRTEQDGIPIAMQAPEELAELCEGAGEAAYVASAIWNALGSADIAAGLMREYADALDAMRRKMGRVLAEPEFLLRRMAIDRGDDAILQDVGHRLRNAGQASIGRALMIETGLITADLQRLEFERVLPVEGLALVAIAPESAS